jgi:hypothetical protein
MSSHADEETTGHYQETGGNDLLSLSTDLVEVRSIFCLLFNYAFPFINLRLQIFTFTKIFWLIASEAVGETAMTLIGISPRCVSLTGKRTVAPFSLGTRMVCWCTVALISFELIRISNLSL